MAVRPPDSDDGLAGLDRLRAEPHTALLATDFDGVLAPIVDDPADAHVQPGAVRVLARLSVQLGAVVIVTGRPVADALRLGGFEGVPGLERLRILGQYGVEQWDATTGEVTAPEPHPGVEGARAAVPALLDELELSEAHVEDKGRALGVHLRRLPDPEAAMARLRDPLAALAADNDLAVEPGKDVLELRAPGMDKGAALDALLAAADLADVRTVLYAGDDLGDLAAYDAVQRLRDRGGAGVLLGVADPAAAERNELVERADLVLGSPAELVGWFDQLADTLSADHPAARHVRPDGVDDTTVEALGKLSEALELVEDARGSLYSFHRKTGAADLALGEAVDLLRAAGHDELADRIAAELVGSNVIEGRWTFQVVEEYDDGYYAAFRQLETQARTSLAQGRRHLYEAEMKERRRTHGRRHHEAGPDHEDSDHHEDSEA